MDPPFVFGIFRRKKKENCVRRIVSPGILLLQTSDSNADLRNTDNGCQEVSRSCVFLKHKTL